MTKQRKDLVLIVCGGRYYDRRKMVFDTLSAIHEKYIIKCIKHGGCSGADSLADEWARVNGVMVEVFEAFWKQEGKAAGPIRNMKMAKSGADLCVVFPGSVGTANMMKCARECSIPVINVDGSEF